MDKARQGTAGQDKIYHGSVRQGPASLDKTRHDPANLGADDRHWECQAIRPASAIDANGAVGCIKPAIGIGAAIPHAAQAQFPIPPPNSLTANFIRALHSGGLLSKIREV